MEKATRESNSLKMGNTTSLKRIDENGSYLMLDMSRICKTKENRMYTFPGGSVVKNPPANAGDIRDVDSIGWKDPLEEGMATHFSILAWEIPWTEELGSNSPWGYKRVGHNLTTEHAHRLVYWSRTFTSMNVLMVKTRVQTAGEKGYKQTKKWSDLLPPPLLHTEGLAATSYS